MLNINFPQSSRQGQLLEAHTARYFAWAASLPAPLLRLAQSRSTITGQPGDEPFTGPASINPLIACVPWLFWEVFSAIPDACFLDIAEAGACLTLASGVIDHLVDGQYEDPGLKTLLYAAFIERGTSLLRELFPPGAAFWHEFDRLNKRYIASLTAEVATQGSLQPIDYDHFCWFSGGKVSPMSITIAALAHAAGKPQLLDPIERSLQGSYVAGQLLDDVLDWEKDFAGQHVTFVLTSFAEAAGLPGAEWPERTALEDANHRKWADNAALDRSIGVFSLAIEAVADLDCPLWKRYLETYRSIAREHADRLMLAHLQSILRSAPAA